MPLAPRTRPKPSKRTVDPSLPVRVGGTAPRRQPTIPRRDGIDEPTINDALFRR